MKNKRAKKAGTYLKSWSPAPNREFSNYKQNEFSNMAPSSSMRQIAAKAVGFKIEIMKWSNRMDLLAISNDKGIVCFQLK